MPCTYLAHHVLESMIIVIIIIHAGSSAVGFVTPNADACSLSAWTPLMSDGFTS